MIKYQTQKSFSLKVVNVFKIIIVLIIVSGVGNLFVAEEKKTELKKASQQIISTISGSPPLAMKGGNPRIRALMRTISSSEANYIKPYNVIYGGEHIEDLSQHPNVCIKISNGPNRGNCSTAAGRYQFLNTTWAEKSALYHSEPNSFVVWKKYSFEAIHQDEVLYKWLTDSQAWEKDIVLLLEEGNIEKVLEVLSPTWTSLGYGIEDNVMTRHLPTIYRKLLKEEFKNINRQSIINHQQSTVNGE